MCPINQYPKSEVATNVKMQVYEEEEEYGELNSKEQSQVLNQKS